MRRARLVERILVRRIDQTAAARRRIMLLIVRVSHDQIEFRQLSLESFDEFSIQQFRNIEIEHLRAMSWMWREHNHLPGMQLTRLVGQAFHFHPTAAVEQAEFVPVI